MSSTLLLASELGEKSLWNPTILGVLVVIAGLVLFAGSTYLLLGTNLGARLGFLVAAACLTGLMVLLSTIWLTTATPLNSPRGRQAEWDAIEVVDSFGDSSIEQVRDITEEGDVVPADQLPNLRPAVEAALVVPSEEGEEVDEPGPFAEFNEPSEVITSDESLSAYEVGGGTKWVLWHHPRYAAVEFCVDVDDEAPFGEPPPEPMCDAAQGTQVLVLERDLGTLRQPPALYLVSSIALFGATLLALHWRERDERAAAREAAEAEPGTEA